MVARTWMLFWLGVTSYASAQNLVPNPSFEELSQFPCIGTRIYPPDNIGQYLVNWYSPSYYGTPDIWNSDTTVFIKGDCSTIYDYYSTQNFIPKAHSGVFDIGLFTLYTGPPKFDKKDYWHNEREYIQTQLIQPLTKGKVYRAEMYVMTMRDNAFFTNNFGMLFTTDPISPQQVHNSSPPIYKQPQVNNQVLFDTIYTWRKITGELVADKEYRFLTIGNFYSDEQTLIQENAQYVFPFNGGYYFFDDISVTDIQLNYTVTIPDLGPDTTLCAHQSLTIELANQSQTRYRWQDGSAANNRIITQSGTYYVTATTGTYSVTDTLHLTVLPLLKLPADTVLCQGEVLTLTPHYPSHALRWNTGSTDSSLTVSQAGQYWVSLVNKQCSVADTINVQVVDCPSQPPNVFTPNGDDKNETFFINHIEFRPWRLDVYNRWGSQVFTSEPYLNQWRGEGLPDGVYYYELYCESLRRRLKGWVTLLR